MEEACGPVSSFSGSQLSGGRVQAPLALLASCILPTTSERGLTLSRVQLTTTLFMRKYEPVPSWRFFSQAIVSGHVGH